MAKAKKGVAGTKTGPKTRKAISAARKRGSTTQDIARAARRDDSTIALIESGVVKNPPGNLAGAIKKSTASSKTATKKTMANKKKAVASRKKHP
jgi:hypothetical protein